MAEQTNALRPRRTYRFGDRTRARTAWINQLLFAAVALVVTVLVVLLGLPGDLGVFFLGVVAIFVITGATLIIPWNTIPLPWMSAIPILDIIVIAVLRLSGPQSGFTLMYAFPAMWLGAGFGLAGLIGGIVTISVSYWITVAMAPASTLGFASVLLPLMVAAVGTTSYLTSRRSAAQQRLLDRQAAVLSRALSRARRQEQLISEVVDAIDFGVIRLSAAGTVVFSNGAHDRWLVDDGEGGADALTDADGVTRLPAEEHPLERARRGEAVDRQVVWAGPPDGPERRALTVTVRRLDEADGADAGAVVVSRDVTAELTALRARDDLVASVSHELRTPLTSILGYLELAIDDDGIPESVRRNLGIAERNAERLLGIVADILAASSDSSSSVELTVRPEDVDVAALARAAVEAIQPRAAERSILLDTAPVEPARAWADPLRLRQVLDNLIGNAVKYNHDGGEVTVGTRTSGETTWIVVRDTGVGITEDEMAGLFERFYRASSIRERGIGGTGLGLAISRDLIRAHGGEITVQSTPGAGSSFIVRLPATSPEGSAG